MMNTRTIQYLRYIEFDIKSLCSVLRIFNIFIDTTSESNNYEIRLMDHFGIALFDKVYKFKTINATFDLKEFIRHYLNKHDIKYTSEKIEHIEKTIYSLIERRTSDVIKFIDSFEHKNLDKCYLEVETRALRSAVGAESNHRLFLIADLGLENTSSNTLKHEVIVAVQCEGKIIDIRCVDTIHNRCQDIYVEYSSRDKLNELVRALSTDIDIKIIHKVVSVFHILNDGYLDSICKNMDIINEAKRLGKDR